jgi:hypothetical protein
MDLAVYLYNAIVSVVENEDFDGRFEVLSIQNQTNKFSKFFLEKKNYLKTFLQIN